MCVRRLLEATALERCKVDSCRSRGECMSSDFSRRTLMKGICSTAVLSAALPAAAVLPAAAADAEYKGPHGPGMPQEGPGTPKLCAPLNYLEITDEQMRRVK